jgi:hypothetical protein
VLTVGEELAAKWITMTGAEARWLKRYMLRHGPGHNPNVVEPATAEPEPPAEGAPADKAGAAPAAARAAAPAAAKAAPAAAAKGPEKPKK